jgi:NADH-quinone oxidoreductase subunit D
MSDDLFMGSKIPDPLVYISRFDPGAGIFPEICYCHAIEELLQLKISRRVKYIRMLLSELHRVTSHLYYLSRINGILGYDFAYNQALMEREKILRLLETISGARVNPNFIRIGGVRNDLSNESVYSIRESLKGIFQKINSLEALMLDNSVITARLKNLGIAEQGMAVGYGVTGPNLRASGVRYDLRKNRNLLLYKDMSFLVPSGKYGDCLDRIQVRFREIYQSIIIISQVIKELPDEHIKEILEPGDQELPFSERVSSIECPHGVFKIFLEAEGSSILNLDIIGPSKNSLYLADKIIQGERFEELELILSSLDISSGEIIRK